MDLERKGKLPAPIGVFASRNLQFEKLPMGTLDVSTTMNLSDVAQQYDLLVLQLPFLVIPFESSLLGAYVTETGREIKPWFLMSRHVPFVVGFRFVLGMRGAGWDHKLVLVEKGQGQHLVDWLGTVALSDPANQFGYRIRSQMCVISDVFEFERHAQAHQVPTLLVPTLCVEMTQGCYYFVHKHKIGLTYPVLVREETTRPNFDAFIARLLAGERDLYGVTDANDRHTPAEDGGPNLLRGGAEDQNGRRLGSDQDKP